MRTPNLRKPVLFVGLTICLSGLLVFLFSTLGLAWNTPLSLAFAVAYMFVPMAAALVIQKLVYKEPVKESLGISFRMNRWFLVVWPFPPVLALASLGVGLLFPGVEYLPGMRAFFKQVESVLTVEQLEQMKSQASAFPIHLIWMGLLQGLVTGTSIFTDPGSDRAPRFDWAFSG